MFGGDCDRPSESGARWDRRSEQNRNVVEDVEEFSAKLSREAFLEPPILAQGDTPFTERLPLRPIEPKVPCAGGTVRNWGWMANPPGSIGTIANPITDPFSTGVIQTTT